MKLLAPALIFCGAAFAQTPQVPHKMQFAGMTLTIHDEVRREIQHDVDALTLHPKYFNIKAERARTYFPIIEKIFTEERLPEDFKYLALQESALVPDAVSSSNAVGFWQFKDFTAKEMGLRVDEVVDERMNIASASLAAARYIKQCNHYFNNW
ncbi:MAG: lytic transglycosylase domain-containing protein, partial [Bacteroidetes bacterium]|nr:lytic transglycosylase domain-containing protein [Bacteroidota bacterium]